MQTTLIWAQDQQATHAMQMLQQSYRLILNINALNLSSQGSWEQGEPKLAVVLLKYRLHA